MRLASVFRKALREALRDRLVVALTIAFAPIFVVLYFLSFSSMVTTFRVVVVDQDEGRSGQELARALGGLEDGTGRSVLEVVKGTDRTAATALLTSRQASALVILPRDFSRSLAAAREDPSRPPATLTIVGDLTSPSYAVAAVLAGAGLETFLARETGLRSPVEVREEPLGGSASRTDFELYVPGLLVFAVIMLVFQAAMAVAREAESGTLRRLQLTRMTSFEYLAGTSAVLLLVALLSVAVTFATAKILGFRSQGPVPVAMLILAVTAFSVIGAGLAVAALSRTVAQAFVIANFPMGLMMFFSGSLFPLPRVALLTVAGQPIGPYDLLPPTHAVAALDAVFTRGAGLRDVAFRLGALALLSALYFAAGVVLLRRRRARSW